MRKVKRNPMWYQVSRFYQISFMIVRTLRCLSSRFLHYSQNTVKDWSLMNFTHFWWIKSWWVLVAYLYILQNVRNLLCILKYLIYLKKTCLPSHIIDYHGEQKKKNLNINIWLMKVKMLDAKNEEFSLMCLVGRMAVLTNTLWFEPIDKWFMV